MFTSLCFFFPAAFDLSSRARLWPVNYPHISTSRRNLARFEDFVLAATNSQHQEAWSYVTFEMLVDPEFSSGFEAKRSRGRIFCATARKPACHVAIAKMERSITQSRVGRGMPYRLSQQEAGEKSELTVGTNRVNNKSIVLFVPGRLCLFGEHSDWAGGHRGVNPELTPGCCITSGTDQGIRARACRHDGLFRASSVLPDGSFADPLELPMNCRELKQLAEVGGFWSYAAGTAHELLRLHAVGGLDVDIFHMDLPIKKGLSSSAALCVLLTKAWNQLYGLGLSLEQEMDIAYRGEILTPSQCGRMDQVCAFGRTVCFLTFDGGKISIEPIGLGGAFHLLIVDLNGSKDTVKILKDLNSHFPDTPGPLSERVREALGPINAEIVKSAQQALKDGDAPALGALMRHAQAVFDDFVTPGSPSELRAPLLHRLLSFPALTDLIYGGKGVGSQGDGTAQLLARGTDERHHARTIIEQDLSMNCLELTLHS